MPLDLCIWCLEHANEKDEEHIIPEALGCPAGFVLPGTVVCRKCNNGLSSLDQAVIDEFDFPAFMAGVQRKGRRPPAIRSRGNVLATIEPTGPTYTYNMESTPVVAHDGSRLAPYRGSKRDVRAKFSTQGPNATISFELTIGQSRKFLRGITKIAFSSLAYFLGAPLARSQAFSPIRQFVRHDIGNRHALVMFDGDSAYANRVSAPFISPPGGHAITFRIAFLEFLIDLSEAESSMEEFRSKAPAHFADKSWFILPTPNDSHDN